MKELETIDSTQREKIEIYLQELREQGIREDEEGSKYENQDNV